MTIFTAGTFDLFHAGHVKLLKRCAQLGDVVVGLNSDRFVERHKGVLPAVPYAERKIVLESCKYVSGVVENYSNDLRRLIEDSGARIVAVGSDWAKKDYYAQIGFGQDWFDDRNILLIYLPYTEDISSTKIKNAIKQT